MASVKVDVNAALENAKKLIETEGNLSSAVKAMFALLISIIEMLSGKMSLTSRNSSKPPASDPNRPKKTRSSGKRKPGGQKGHQGTTLKPVENPDQIVDLKVDRGVLPEGNYQSIGYEARQVVELTIERTIIEYRAEIIRGRHGKRYQAPFPQGIEKPIQYGRSVKAHASYLSSFQLLPYERLADYFKGQLKLSVSQGTLFTFNQEAYNRLTAWDFAGKARAALITSSMANADETGINIAGQKRWLHCVRNPLWTYFMPHAKRGSQAMDAMGILPYFRGVLVHDHWKPYYTYHQCLHSLCNAHHLRELTWVAENTPHQWAQLMIDLLLEINKAVKESPTATLSEIQQTQYIERYRKILAEGAKESLPPQQKTEKKKGRLKKTKDRNLLERLIDYEADVLRFMTVSDVPFTNNGGENDIRMTKVQQKISGCYRSEGGARIFCMVRSYLLTCQKHDISPTEAMTCLFADDMPEFLKNQSTEIPPNPLWCEIPNKAA